MSDLKQSESEKNRRSLKNNIFFTLLMIGFGIYRLTHAGHLTTLSRTWSWFLVIGGVAFLIITIIALLAPSPEKAAKQQHQLQRGLYGQNHTREIVDEREISARGLDLNFYHTVTAQLTTLGFRQLADFIIPQMDGSMPSAKSVLRVFLSPDGTIMAAAYDVRFTGLMRLLQIVRIFPRTMQTIDLETELSDGSFVTTSTAALAAKATDVPGIVRQFLPGNTPLQQLLASHQNFVRTTLSNKAAVHPLQFNTFEELGASQDRQHELKSRFRNSSKFDAAAEVQRIAGRPLQAGEREFAEQLQRLNAEQRNADSNHPG